MKAYQERRNELMLFHAFVIHSHARVGVHGLLVESRYR